MYNYVLRTVVGYPTTPSTIMPTGAVYLDNITIVWPGSTSFIDNTAMGSGGEHSCIVTEPRSLNQVHKFCFFHSPMKWNAARLQPIKCTAETPKHRKLCLKVPPKSVIAGSTYVTEKFGAESVVERRFRTVLLTLLSRCFIYTRRVFYSPNVSPMVRGFAGLGENHTRSCLMPALGKGSPVPIPLLD